MTGNPVIAKYVRDEIVAQVIADTTLAHNRWSLVPGRKNIFRSTGGFTLLVYLNRFTVQTGGESRLLLDEFDIKDIISRADVSVRRNRRFDLENAMDVDVKESVGRLDSQITVAIHKNDVKEFFARDGFVKTGRERSFGVNINGEKRFTGCNWTKNREVDPYLLCPDDLKKCPQTDQEKRDFFRIYDKLAEIIDTTLPHSDKRHLLIDKYSQFIDPDYRIFRIEIQENDRGLTKYLGALLDSDKATFVDIAKERLQKFSARNPWRLWTDLLSERPKAGAKK